MHFDILIKDHTRLEQFYNRVWENWNLHFTNQNENELYQDANWYVNISYLALLKHIAIGGNWYSRMLLREFNLNVTSHREVYNFNNEYEETTLPFFWIGKVFKTIGILLEFFDFFSFTHMNNFIPRWFLDKTEKRYMSYRIGQWLTCYLASEIDNIFFSLPYDEIWENLSREVRNQIREFRRTQNIRAWSSPDLIGFFLDEDTVRSIALESKGLSRSIHIPNNMEDIADNSPIRNWKNQSRASWIQVEYWVVSATYDLYQENTCPKCLYYDPNWGKWYQLKKEDYIKLLNTYYQPFRDLIRHFGFALLEKNIQGVDYYVLNLGRILSKTPCLSNLWKCLDYYHLHYNCFSFMSHHNFYFRKDFLDIDWETEKDFSIFKKHHKIQELNLYIDNDWIWFGIDD